MLEFADTMPRVDLVLMDLHLPYEDGYDALAKLRSDSHFANTLVVAVTADANPVSMEKATLQYVSYSDKTSVRMGWKAFRKKRPLNVSNNIPIHK